VKRAEIFGQLDWPARLAWGRRGAREAAGRGDVLVVVDTLSFSSAVATAVARGATVLPYAGDEVPPADAEVAARREDVPARGRFSLSPLTLLDAEPGIRVAIRSPNGAACVRHGRRVPRLLVGTLLNAGATAEAARELRSTNYELRSTSTVTSGLAPKRTR